MSSTPYSGQSSIWPPQDGEELPHANTEPLEAAPVYDQVEIWEYLVQIGQQPNFPPDEARITEVYYTTDENTLTSYPQTQFQGIGGDFTTQSPLGDRINRTTGSTGRPRHACVYCNKTFGRNQELGRHVKDVHMLPQQCPFCAFMWTRPCKLKEHLMADHVRGFSPEMLEAIKPLRGQGLVKFLYGNVTP